MKNLITFSRSKSKAKAYLDNLVYRREIEGYSNLKLHKKQYKHIIGWKTFEYKPKYLK